MLVKGHLELNKNLKNSLREYFIVDISNIIYNYSQFPIITTTQGLNDYSEIDLMCLEYDTSLTYEIGSETDHKLLNFLFDKGCKIDSESLCNWVSTSYLYLNKNVKFLNEGLLRLIIDRCLENRAFSYL